MQTGTTAAEQGLAADGARAVVSAAAEGQTLGVLFRGLDSSSTNIRPWKEELQ
jgi:hypothetical protein